MWFSEKWWQGRSHPGRQRDLAADALGGPHGTFRNPALDTEIVDNTIIMPNYTVEKKKRDFEDIPPSIDDVMPVQSSNQDIIYDFEDNDFKTPSKLKRFLKYLAPLLENVNVMQLGFIILALGLLIFLSGNELLMTQAITFVSIVLEAFPFMLIGALVGGCVEVFVSRDRITSILPEKRWSTAFLAAGLGVIFPVCECAVVPVVNRLLRKGVPLSAAIAFLLGGPIVNPLVAISTTVAYSSKWKIALIRLFCGYIIAVSVGMIMDMWYARDQVVLEDLHPDDTCCKEHDDMVLIFVNGTPNILCSKIAMAVRHAAEDFFDISRYFIVGAFIAGLMQTFVVRSTFASVAGTSFVSILLMMGLAIILNLCSEADAFVAASFRKTPVPLSAQMAFMVLGPMLDIKLILMYLHVFQKRAIVTLALMTFFIVFLSMITLGILI